MTIKFAVAPEEPAKPSGIKVNFHLMKRIGTYCGQGCGGEEGEGEGEKLSGRQSNSPSRRKYPLDQGT